MSSKLRTGVVALLVVGALTVAMAGTALAQEETPTPAPAPFHGRGFGRGIGGQVGLEAAAAALNMDVDELSTQLWGGKTLTDLARATQR